MNVKRIGILTSGGDCPGLNAVIESVVRCANQNGIEVYGFVSGYDGLYTNEYKVLNYSNVKGIGRDGGSIIKSSNKTNLFNHRKVDENGNVTYADDSMVAVENLKKDNIDCMVIVGGDGSMTSARDFKRAGINVVCVPKTIDNDVPYTDQTFGYYTSVCQIAHAIESIRTTAYSHDRVMIVETMGRHAGWLALEGGLSGNADCIIIPEIPYDLSKIKDYLVKRYNDGHKSTVICVSEGAKPIDGEIKATINNEYPDAVKLGGIGAKLAVDIEREIKNITGQEVRSTNVGYIQRGGDCQYFDRVLSYEYAKVAVDAILSGNFGVMVSFNGHKTELVPLEKIVGNGQTGETSKGGNKNVEKDSLLLTTAKSMGIYFGD